MKEKEKELEKNLNKIKKKLTSLEFQKKGDIIFDDKE